jgi:hypothetical protein
MLLCVIRVKITYSGDYNGFTNDNSIFPGGPGA